MNKTKPIEAIHIMDLHMDEQAAIGTPRHAKALKLLNEAKQIWKDQLWQRLNPKCPHCHCSIKQ